MAVAARAHTPVDTDSFLLDQHGAPGRDLDQRRYQQHERCAEHQATETQKHVEPPLPGLAAADTTVEFNGNG